MKPSRVLLLTGIFLIAFGTPSKGNGQALKQWLDSAKQVYVAGEESAYDAVRFHSIHENVEEAQQMETIVAAKDKRYDNLILFSGYPISQIDQSRQSQTNFLPWHPDKATFLRLDHGSPWYVTSPLSGCDVWIADHQNFDPLTIHINANSLGQFPLKNLEYKEKLANIALNYFNERVMLSPAYYYKFIQRISYDYANDRLTTPQEKQEIDNYWKDFRLPYVLYHTNKGELGFLYGTYASGWFSNSWNFVLKELSSGKILLKLDCNESSTQCSIQ